MSLEDLLTFAVMQRMIERGVIFLFIILLAIALLWAYRKSVQKIDMSITLDKLGLGAAVVPMPVFLMLVLVGFSYILFSQAISVSSERGDVSIEGRFASPIPQDSAVEPENIISALGIMQEYVASAQISDIDARSRVSAANRVLEIVLGELVDEEFGDGAYGFYLATKAQLGSGQTLATLGLSAEEEDLYLDIDDLFDGSEIMDGN